MKRRCERLNQMSQDSEWSNGYKAGLEDGRKEELLRIAKVIAVAGALIDPVTKNVLLEAIGYSEEI